MDSNYRKTLFLFRIWCNTRYPEFNLPVFIEQFEKEYDDFKALLEEFIKTF